VIVEATFKVRPRPETQAVFALLFSSPAQAMDLALRVLGSELQPFFVEVANFDPTAGHAGAGLYCLFVGFAGIAEEITYQHTRLRELVGDGEPACLEWPADQEQALAQTLQNFPVAGEAVLRCKASLLPTQIASFCKAVEEEAALRGGRVQLLAHAGNGIVYSRFLPTEAMAPEKLLSFVDWLRILTKKLDGYLVVEAAAPAVKDRVDVWGHVGGAFPLMKRLKETLDPQGILNPGRFVGSI
jgi:glycolate oxidase FAD binding subunit